MTDADLAEHGGEAPGMLGLGVGCSTLKTGMNRMDLVDARWSLSGTEAILKVRAVMSMGLPRCSAATTSPQAPLPQWGHPIQSVAEPIPPEELNRSHFALLWEESSVTEQEEPAAVNYVQGLMDFLIRWEQGDESSHCDPVDFAVSDIGNINLSGTPECYTSYLLTRWHPSFESSIEPGIRELVVGLIDAWDCVTYSCCEGHPANGSVPARLRHVRLIARSPSEHQRLVHLLERLAAVTNENMPHSAVRLRVSRTVVAAEDGLEAPGLDLLFEPDICDNAEYVGELEPVYRECLLHVRR